MWLRFVDQAKDNITIDWCVLANLPFVVFNCHQKNSLEVKDCQANFLLFDRVGFVGDQEPFALLPHLQRSAAVAHLQSQTNLFDSHTSYTRTKESGWVLAGQAIYCPMKELHGLMSFE